MKILFVGDLHLRERELSTTKGLVKNSIMILEGIKKVLEEDEDIKLVIFEGDIQHDTPKTQRTLRETTIWKKLLGDIGSIISLRIPKLVIVPRFDSNGSQVKQVPNALPLFTAKGNHDIEKTLRSVNTEYNYTFFDDIIYTGTLQNPRGIIFKDLGQVYYIQLNNYGEITQPIVDEVISLDPNIKTIKVLHDTVKVASSPSWFNLLGEDSYYVGEKVLGDCDVAVCGHIHEPLSPIDVKGDGTLGTKVTKYIQTGSMARTSFTDESMRDYGFCTILDTSNDLEVSELRIPLMPTVEYFNWKQINLNNIKKDAIKKGQMFNLDFNNVVKDQTDVRDTIENMIIQKEVKENILNTINEVDDNN